MSLPIPPHPHIYYIVGANQDSPELLAPTELHPGRIAGILSRQHGLVNEKGGAGTGDTMFVFCKLHKFTVI